MNLMILMRDCFLDQSDAAGFFSRDGDIFVRTEDFDVSGTIGLDNTFIAKNLRAGFTVLPALVIPLMSQSQIYAVNLLSNTDNSNERDFIIRTRWTHQLAPRTTAAIDGHPHQPRV